MSYKYDVFVSYRWDQHKESVHKLANELERNNFKIWIDKNEITHGSITKAMQEGLNESALVLCCVTSEYVKEGSNSLAEFNYASDTKKKIIYVIFENIKGLNQDDIVKKFETVGFRMSDKLRFSYDPKDIKPIVTAIQNTLNDVCLCLINYTLNNLIMFFFDS